MAVRTRRKPKRRGGKARAGRLLGETTVRVRAGRTRVVKVRVPRKRRRMIRQGKTRRLRAQLWLGAPKPRQYDVRCKRRARRR